MNNFSITAWTSHPYKAKLLVIMEVVHYECGMLRIFYVKLDVELKVVHDLAKPQLVMYSI